MAFGPGQARGEIGEEPHGEVSADRAGFEGGAGTAESQRVQKLCRYFGLAGSQSISLKTFLLFYYYLSEKLGIIWGMISCHFGFIHPRFHHQNHHPLPHHHDHTSPHHAPPVFSA